MNITLSTSSHLSPNKQTELNILLRGAVLQKNSPMKWKTVEGLIKRGADPTYMPSNPYSKEDKKRTYFYIFEKQAPLTLCLKILTDPKFGININDGDKINNNTPLHMRVRKNKVSEYELLQFLQLGARVDVRNNRYKTPIDCAKNPQIKDLLRRWGQDHPGGKLSSQEEEVENLDQTALNERLHGAVQNGQYALMGILLRKGADPHFKPHEKAQETYFLAVTYPIFSRLKILLMESKQKIDLNKKSKRGNTALHKWAASSNTTVEIIQTLLQNGADTNVRNKKGQTPIDVAKNEKIRAYLIENQTPDNGGDMDLDEERSERFTGKRSASSDNPNAKRVKYSDERHNLGKSFSLVRPDNGKRRAPPS